MDRRELFGALEALRRVSVCSAVGTRRPHRTPRKGRSATITCTSAASTCRSWTPRSSSSRTITAWDTSAATPATSTSACFRRVRPGRETHRRRVHHHRRRISSSRGGEEILAPAHLRGSRRRSHRARYGSEGRDGRDGDRPQYLGQGMAHLAEAKRTCRRASRCSSGRSWAMARSIRTSSPAGRNAQRRHQEDPGARLQGVRPRAAEHSAAERRGLHRPAVDAAMGEDKQPAPKASPVRRRHRAAVPPI